MEPNSDDNGQGISNRETGREEEQDVAGVAAGR
jgi:hypothetical protein